MKPHILTIKGGSTLLRAGLGIPMRKPGKKGPRYRDVVRRLAVALSH